MVANAWLLAKNTARLHTLDVRAIGYWLFRCKAVGGQMHALMRHNQALLLINACQNNLCSKLVSGRLRKRPFVPNKEYGYLIVETSNSLRPNLPRGLLPASLPASREYSYLDTMAQVHPDISVSLLLQDCDDRKPSNWFLPTRSREVASLHFTMRRKNGWVPAFHRNNVSLTYLDLHLSFASQKNPFITRFSRLT